MKYTKPTLIISVILLLIVAVSLIVIWQKTQTKFQPLSGKIIDAISKKPLDNIDIQADSQREKTDEKGEFHFEKVSKEGKIKITGKGLFREISIPIAGRKYIEIFIDNSLFNLFVYLEKWEEDRQYRKIYRVFHPDIKAVYSEEKYLKDKNAWRDKKTDQGLKILKPEFKTEIKILENWKSDLTKKEYQNVREVILVNNFEEIETGKIKKEEKKVYFIKENGSWWIYEL
jgi:hypothetical protein